MTTERTEAPEPEAPPQRPPPQWLNSTLEWGTRARIGKGGLTLGALNVGLYGEIPDRWDEMTRMPRGAFPVPGVPPIQRYPLNAKVDLWADNAADLYEEGISRRWIPAQDIPWEQATRLPDDVELALAQVCTELSQQAQVEMDTVSRWLQEMSYGYHEVKVYLATEVFDAGRHFEAFRKRALVNGGGLGLESPGQFNRFLLEVRAGWTETSVALHLLRGSFAHMLYRYLAAYAPTPADVMLFQFALQDNARHTAYSLQHLHYAISRNPQKALDLQTTLGGAESFAVQDERDPVLWEALAIVFGGGVRQIDEGMQVVRRLRRDYVERYLALLKWVGVDRRERLNKELARNLEPGAVAAA